MPDTEPNTHVPELRIRCPDDRLPAAIDLAAERQFTTRSGYVRAAVLAQLRADGIDPAQLGSVAA